MVMEFIEGQTLAKLLDQKSLDRATTLGYIRQIAAGLQAVHAGNYIHRDLKPANIMVDTQGNAILIDFGAARDFVHQHSQTPILTPGYAPPEQYARQVNQPTADIYALTATLYRCWFGKAPTPALQRQKNIPLPLLADLQPWQKDLFERGLALEENDRIQTAAEFLKLSDNQTTVPDLKNDDDEKTKPDLKNDNEKTKPDLKNDDEKTKPDLKNDNEKTKPDLKNDDDEKTKPDLKNDDNEKTEPDLKNDDDEKTKPGQKDDPKPPVIKDRKKKSPLPWLAAAIILLIGGIWGYSAYQKNQDDFEKDMVYVEGGTFTMGCTPEQGNDCDSDEKPTHRVTLASFQISKYEVTQAQWEAVMGANPSYFKNCADCPVEQVSWNDIQKFLRRLNQMTGKDYRLPTEAQWEFAARGGNKSRGYKYAGSDDLDAVAWYRDNSGSKTHPVGQKQPNELGPL